ncbi:MAG: hypothetical protein ABFC84_08410 [Veillonellales bacterium]
MRLSMEIKTEHQLEVNNGDYFSVALVNNGQVIPETSGRDQYNLNDFILPGKRIAGFGRTKQYALDDLPAGLGPLEAAESAPLSLEENQLKELTVALETNVILDQGQLAYYLSLAVAADGGMPTEIPLLRPDVAIDWTSRGNYLIKIPC